MQRSSGGRCYINIIRQFDWNIVTEFVMIRPSLAHAWNAHEIAQRNPVPADTRGSHAAKVKISFPETWDRRDIGTAGSTLDNCRRCPRLATQAH